jgi:peptidoglycan/xylan/chitin deacetylase (PgdA/CDA1 family)
MRRVAALGGRSMVLVYHRIGVPGSPCLIPTVPVDEFRTHLQALQTIGEIVPLSRLLTQRRSARLRFALTFDDDHLCHTEVVLPILLEHRLHATFFLSGRSLHGLGPYWFQALENLVRERGVVAIAELLGVEVSDAFELASICEASPALQAKLETLDRRPAGSLDEAQLARLSGAGMGIGFHTLHHRPVTRLEDVELDKALTEGRSDLEAATGVPITFFAYPHGKADARVAGRVRASSYEAAWTGSPSPITRRADPFLLGRWEPGAVAAPELVLKATGRVARPRVSP